MPKAVNPGAVRKRGADPAGRVDILAIRVLERFVENSSNLLIRGIYGSSKKDIDRALRQNLGQLRFYMDGYGRVRLGGRDAR